jgi:GNAT superfamily N-acetyltransferase
VSSSRRRTVRLGPVRIRPATREDVGLLHELIRALADYERAPDAVTGTPEMLARGLFGEPPAAEAVIAELEGEPAGFALFHGTFSTWECSPGLWLEDLFVRPERRGAGVGEALLRHLAAVALERGCKRLEWAALDWNELALGFYRRLGAEVLETWLLHRVDGDTLSALSARPAPAA